MTTDRIAFVGDIHGNLVALNGLLSMLESTELDNIVFLGDYINKGAFSVEVIERLLELTTERPITLLRGNHETTLLTALETGDLATFLKIGGASTIRSYVKRPLGPDVLQDFRSSLPSEHLAFLRGMQHQFETSHIIASHRPLATDEVRFQISAHVPVGDQPAISQNSAYIDTGCGSSTGRLTALIWPPLTFIQVDSGGMPL
jgi:serine/threonine protein phosphatase 1